MRKFHYSVSENKLLTPTIRSIRLVCNDEVTPLLYQPGQYATISLHDKFRPTTTRCFSISSSPTDRSELEFCVRVGGKYTAALERLQPGDAVTVRGPFGNFVLRDRKYDTLVFFAGGIGITPFISMIRYANDLQLATKIHLIFSCSKQEDIPFLEELTALQQSNPQLQVTYVIGSGPTDRLTGINVISGRIDEQALRRLNIISEKTAYMICGPSGYIQAMQHLLNTQGIHNENVYHEAFNQGSKQHHGASMQWPTNVYALSGVSLLILGIFIVGSDLSKTIPTLQSKYASPLPTPIATTTSIQDIPPQVDTNIRQEPIVNKKTNTATKIIKAPAPVVSPPVPKAIVPTPKAIVTPPKPVVTTPKPTVTTPAAPVVKKPTPTVTPITPPKTQRS